MREANGERRTQLLRTIRCAASAGMDYIQFREKDLCIRELELLAREALQLIRSEGPSRLLINHRTDVALAVGADGVHLTGADIAAIRRARIRCKEPTLAIFFRCLLPFRATGSACRIAWR